MTDNTQQQLAKPKKKRDEIRYDREAKALQKNLEKRKKQQLAREELNAKEEK